MEKEKLIKLTKELIFIAATYDKKEKSKLEEVVKKLELAKKDINENTDYAKTVLGFIDDIIDDIKNEREINLDNSKSDDYLENYFITKNEIDIYNNIIDITIYNDLIEELNNKSIDIKKIKSLISDLYKNFYNNIEKNNPSAIAKNLLIFTLFKRNIVTELLLRLYNKIGTNNNLSEEKLKLANMSRKYKLFLKDVYKYGDFYLKKGKFNTHFLEYKINNGKIELKDIYTDASRTGIRNGNKIFEYKRILINLK